MKLDENINFLGKCLLAEEKGKKILVIGDLHLGQEEVMNRTGVFVTRSMFGEMIRELNKVFSKIGGNKEIDEVVLLGDVKHDFGVILKQEWKDVSGLFDYLEERAKKIIIVKGNHDGIIEPLSRERGISVVDYYIINGIAFLHGDKNFKEIFDKKVKMWIIGHGHPAIKLRDKEGVKVEKYKCFLIGKFKGKEIVIVPSFSEVSIGSDARDRGIKLAWKFDYDKFEVYIVGNGLEVLNFGRLGKMR